MGGPERMILRDYVAENKGRDVVLAIQSRGEIAIRDDVRLDSPILDREGLYYPDSRTWETYAFPRAAAYISVVEWTDLVDRELSRRTYSNWTRFDYWAKIEVLRCSRKAPPLVWNRICSGDREFQSLRLLSRRFRDSEVNSRSRLLGGPLPVYFMHNEIEYVFFGPEWTAHQVRAEADRLLKQDAE